MLVTKIVSFSHNVFKKLSDQGRLNSVLCGKELNFLRVLETILHHDQVGCLRKKKTCFFFYFNLTRHAIVFTCLQYKLENIVGKEEIAFDEQILLFTQCFVTFFENF